MDTAELNQRKGFHATIMEWFSEEDLRQAAFDIGVDWDDLSGKAKAAKLRSMILWLEDRGKLYKLVGWCQEKRPKVNWTGFG